MGGEFGHTGTTNRGEQQDTRRRIELALGPDFSGIRATGRRPEPGACLPVRPVDRDAWSLADGYAC